MASPLEVTYPRPEIAILTLNRPDTLNALSYELVEDLHSALDAIAVDNICRVVVLTGAGRGFCSGLDLSAPSPPDAGGGTEFPRSGMRWQERIANLTAKIHRLRQPVIAAVNGAAYGGGFGIALACDLRIASTSARFCTQFIRLGLGGCDIGVSYTLPRIVESTLRLFGKFGVESTKQVLWANLDASSLEAALHLENRSQILASTSGGMREAAAAILRKT